MFNGTVFENIANGLAGTPLAHADDEQKRKLVEEACRAAFASEFIEKMPHGYDTQIGERGAMLSGGQKQRLAIARSVISNPRVLLLDEATSALDPNAEKIVQKALNSVAVGRTMVVIAHRLSTIRDANNIVVLSSGAVIEQGTHGELIARGGAYSKLVLAQDLGQDEEHELQEKGTDTDDGAVDAEKMISRVLSSGVHDGQDPEKQTSGNDYSLLKSLWILGHEQAALWPTFLIIWISCVVAGATYPALAVLFSRVMEAFELTGAAQVERGDYYALMFFLVALGNLVAYGFLGFYSNNLSRHVVKSYRLEIFNNLIRQDMSFFDKPGNTTGALTTHLSEQPQNLRELLSFNITVVLIVIINLISSCILAIVIGWKLGLVLVFGALPPLVFSGYLRIRLEFKLDGDTSRRFADSTAIASEAVMAIRTVASLALERQIIDRYEGSLQHIARTSLKGLFWTMFWYSLSQSISFLAMALGFWYGGRLMSYGEYTGPQFYVVFIAVVFSGEAAAMFFTYSTSFSKARHATNFIFKLRASVPAENKDDKPPRPENQTDSGASIDCQSLEFAYPQRPRAKVLSGVSPQVKPSFFPFSSLGPTDKVSLDWFRSVCRFCWRLRMR